MLTDLITILARNNDADLMKDAVGAVSLVVLLVAGLAAPGFV